MYKFMLENADLYRAVPRELNLLEISFIVEEPHPFNQDLAFFVECIPDLGICYKNCLVFLPASLVHLFSLKSSTFTCKIIIIYSVISNYTKCL
jgi:hypothetical protein